ncbi:Coenzyme F420 hydrogenase/dehydrogenase, beta subunit C-terminal domain [Lutibacter sp. TH_r2]|uniref:Coenzyme F420 hydrogenase/dehydrogenase, beta subunit C-terminal domain n=1 Tax=Lutibacter sp. TH_r2 TaxID=3082083 RepID=UPI002953B89B|nr:Coenzyme F420 hydrogenase/dehydrogenase, beta subunit C-terminal domain [Lutibacter sp. TH_r2]MDV7187791.1 Coenzyme F420 hydrogenase/dehydrogenase, beta subunit C-terminal domain [Lutibacter sp. TH_r2]
MCTGCGICTSFCDAKALKMDWNDLGFLVPHKIGDCSEEASCISVCPFNPFPEDEVKTETEISNLFLPADDSTKFHSKIGKYKNTYVGYSKEFRKTSSSGGIATYVTIELINQGIIDYIVNVKEVGDKFSYVITSKEDNIKSTSKTRYYPVTLESVLDKVANLEGKVAIVGVPCFLKAIRLAQYRDNLLKEKIVFTIAIICGGIKSKFFTEYLVQKTGVKNSSIKKVEYRVKDFNSTAGDYSFGVISEKSERLQTVKMRTLGDMWGTGLFKCNACDFCDDVSGELADISLGDAWIRPYVNEGGGNNVIVTRSTLADNIIIDGIKSSFLNVKMLPESEFVRSQKGSFTHRQDCLSYRMKLSEIKNLPPKRIFNKFLSPEVKLIQRMRRITREKSLVTWKSKRDIDYFDKEMMLVLKRLRMVTKINHYKRGVLERLKRIF